MYRIAATLVAPTVAEAATPFTTFSFSSTGGTGSQTMPDRLAQIISVKDYGAKGDGSTDDTANIQAAINAAIAKSEGSGVAAVGTTVFFPPGQYKITSALNPGTGNSNLRFIGAGSASGQPGGSAQINGNFADFLISVTSSSNGNTLMSIENLSLNNTSTNTSSGGLRLDGAENTYIRNCAFQGYVGAHLGGAGYQVFGIMVDNCFFSNNSGSDIPGTGTTGSYCGYVSFRNCTFFGFDNGVVASNICCMVHGCRFEDNGIAIRLGTTDGGSRSQITSFSVIDNTFESNDTCIYVDSASAGIISANRFTGNAVPPSSSNPHYGIRVTGALQNAIVTGNTSTSTYQVKGVDMSAAGSLSLVVFAGHNGSSWGMPPANIANGVSYINSDNPANTLTFANLPATPVEGMEFTINDALAGNCGDGSCNNWATTVTGGTGSLHRQVYYNGSNWTISAK